MEIPCTFSPTRLDLSVLWSQEMVGDKKGLGENRTSPTVSNTKFSRHVIVPTLHTSVPREAGRPNAVGDDGDLPLPSTPPQMVPVTGSEEVLDSTQV